MQIVIDIPEQIYLNAKTDTLCGADILVSAIKNGIPHETVTEFADRCRECGREKVLNKIRNEIKDRPSLMMSTSKEYERGVNAMLYQALSIIDKYREVKE